MYDENLINLMNRQQTSDVILHFIHCFVLFFCFINAINLFFFKVQYYFNCGFSWILFTYGSSLNVDRSE